MGKTKKEAGKRKTLETEARKRVIVYIYSGLIIYLEMVLVHQII
jgi:hypothetical protein